MKKSLLPILFLSVGSAFAQARNPPPVVVESTPGITGKLDTHALFPSRFVAPRNVQVWLPPDYFTHAKKRYPVIYMHDGKNLWDANVTWNKQAWEVDDMMTELIGEGAVRSAIVVGIDQTAKRFEEYMPRKAITTATIQGLPQMPAVSKDQILSDEYLKFVVKELKPFVDSRYRTQPDRDNTFMMGSSMGGLISLYAISEYPDVFGAVAAISTHWPVGDGVMIRYMDAHLPSPKTHRIYYDHGTQTLDAAYTTYQSKMDIVMRQHGYHQGQTWVTRTFDGAAHDERSWNARLDVPLRFLLKP